MVIIKLNIADSPHSFKSSRIVKVLSGDRDTALHMGWWDKLCDFFRTESKADVLKQLYDLLYEVSSQPVLNDLQGTTVVSDGERYTICHNAFNKLQALATFESQMKFVKNF